MEILVTNIEVSERKRPIVARVVNELVESIKVEGLLQPPVVRAIPGSERFKLLVGAQRVEAYKQMGWTHIPVIVLDHSARVADAKLAAKQRGASQEQIDSITEELFDELAEINENIVRENLPPEIEEIQLARRKAIFQALHPEATKTGSQAKATRAAAAKRNALKTGEVPEVQNEPADSGRTTGTFIADTAAVTGKSESTIKREVRRGETPGAEKLVGCGTSAKERDAIADLHKEDPEGAQEVISKIASGEAAGTVLAKTKKKKTKLRQKDWYEEYELPADLKFTLWEIAAHLSDACESSDADALQCKKDAQARLPELKALCDEGKEVDAQSIADALETTAEHIRESYEKTDIETMLSYLISNSAALSEYGFRSDVQALVVRFKALANA
jgi:ParB-like chromosome segregation protein Spo0J